MRYQPLRVVAWARGGPAHSAARITVLTWRKRGWLLIAIAATAVGIGSALHYRTDASLPYWDSLAPSLSVSAQWLLMRKNIDTWPLWIAADVLSIGVYAGEPLSPASRFCRGTEATAGGRHST